MKEFCSNFKIALLDDVQEINNDEVILLPDKDFDELATDSLSIICNPEAGNAGIIYSISQDIIIDKVTEDVASKYNIQRSVVIIAFFTDNTQTVYGSFNYPVRVVLARGVQSDTLTITLKTTDRPVI